MWWLYFQSSSPLPSNLLNGSVPQDTAHFAPSQGPVPRGSLPSLETPSPSPRALVLEGSPVPQLYTLFLQELINELLGDTD